MHAGALRVQQRASNALELALQVVVSWLTWVLGNKPVSFGRAATALICWLFAPALIVHSNKHTHRERQRQRRQRQKELGLWKPRTKGWGAINISELTLMASTSVPTESFWMAYPSPYCNLCSPGLGFRSLSLSDPSILSHFGLFSLLAHSWFLLSWPLGLWLSTPPLP